MKRIFALLLCFFLLYSLNIYADGLRIGYLSPADPSFSYFSESFLNGLYLGLPKQETVIVQNVSEKIDDVLENLYLSSADVIIGPFLSNQVDTAKNSICSSGIVTILPFAKPDYICSNIFVYNYDPIKAALQLSKMFSDKGLGETLVLYEYDDLDIAKKDAFLEGLSSQSAQVHVKGFVKSKSYDGFVKTLFGVRKTRQKSSLTESAVYEHSLHVNSVVIFASQGDFINIANLLDYYSINLKTILSTDITVNNDLLSLSSNILKKTEFVTPYYLCSNDPENTAFVKQYESEYQNDPNFMSALGFDIGRLLKNADRVSLQARLRQTADFDGLIGRLLFFNDTGNGIINYRLLTYEDIKKCRKVILSK